MPRWGKRRVNIKKRRLFFIVLIFFFLSTYQLFLYIERQLEPILMSIAQARVKQIATNAVNDAISKKIAQNTNFNELIEFERDNQGRIVAAVLNYSEFARIIGEATARVEDTLNDLAKLEERIKLGAAFNSELLADWGPSIPISIIPIGSIQVNPYPMYQNIGINNVLMTVMMDIRAEVQVVIPFVTEPTVIKSSIPIVAAQIFGEVPQFYFDSKSYGQPSNSSSYPPPIQIIPGAPIIPNSNQQNTNQESIPSSATPADPIHGLEQFYPIVPRETTPSNG